MGLVFDFHSQILRIFVFLGPAMSWTGGCPATFN